MQFQLKFSPPSYYKADLRDDASQINSMIDPDVVEMGCHAESGRLVFRGECHPTFMRNVMAECDDLIFHVTDERFL